MSVRSLARKLGISATAVSLALKDSPRISPRLRAKVRHAAQTEGHVPNAKLAELMSAVRLSSQPRYHATLGVISLFPEEEPWRQTPTYEHLETILGGARDRAALRGYKLENFWLKAPRMTPRRLAAILEARGIHGLFCLGSFDPDEVFPTALQRFAVVTQGASIPGRMHRVVSHFAADARSVFAEIARRGYRRPGMAILRSGDRRTDYLYSATFLGEQERSGRTPTVPILRAETWNEADFHTWFTTHRPDVVIIHQYAAYLAEIERYLARRKLSVPRDVGLALLDKNPDTSCYAGMCQRPERIGAAAVDLLLSRLLLRDFAAPEFPKVELVVGTWNEGKSLRSPRSVRSSRPETQ
jgi:DNA-binding LacI/PurR family transcriptional regulator